MEKKKSIQEIKELLGYNYRVVDTRVELEKMIDPNKYYIVHGHILPFKGSTVLKRNFQPCLIEHDLGYTISAEDWKKYNELKEQQTKWIQQLQQQTYQEDW